MDKPVWIHIGMPKCASTSLQKGFFAACHEIDFIGRNDHALGLPSRHKPLLAIASLDELGYKANKDKIKQELFESFSLEKTIKVHVLSDEIIGSAYRPFVQTIPVADIYQSADRLKELFPKAHILIVIRNQVDLLASWYPQIMRNISGKFDVHQCFKQHKQFYDAGQGSYFYQFDYYRLYQLYVDFFGEENIYVICIEDMIENQAFVLKRIIGDMGLSDNINPINYMQKKENKRASAGDFGWLQLFNRFIDKRLGFLPKNFHESLKRMTKGKPIKVVFTEDELKYLKKIYATGNRKLQDATGLDLSGKGYLI